MELQTEIHDPAFFLSMAYGCLSGIDDGDAASEDESLESGALSEDAEPWALAQRSERALLPGATLRSVSRLPGSNSPFSPTTEDQPLENNHVALEDTEEIIAALKEAIEEQKEGIEELRGGKEELTGEVEQLKRERDAQKGKTERLVLENEELRKAQMNAPKPGNLDTIVIDANSKVQTNCLVRVPLLWWCTQRAFASLENQVEVLNGAFG